MARCVDTDFVDSQYVIAYGLSIVVVDWVERLDLFCDYVDYLVPAAGVSCRYQGAEIFGQVGFKLFSEVSSQGLDTSVRVGFVVKVGKRMSVVAC